MRDTISLGERVRVGPLRGFVAAVDRWDGGYTEVLVSRVDGRPIGGWWRVYDAKALVWDDEASQWVARESALRWSDEEADA